MSVKITINLKEKIAEIGQSKADTHFNGNFSAYVANLIAKDNELVLTNVISEVSK